LDVTISADEFQGDANIQTIAEAIIYQLSFVVTEALDYTLMAAL
jgi:hypothetical protein